MYLHESCREINPRSAASSASLKQVVVVTRHQDTFMLIRNIHLHEWRFEGWGTLQNVGSIYSGNCTSAFSASESSVTVSQGKLTSLLIALLVITECSWSSAVSKRGRAGWWAVGGRGGWYFSLRLSFLQTAGSSNALQRGSAGRPWLSADGVWNQQF